jgi:magnesium chelatase subunit H
MQKHISAAEAREMAVSNAAMVPIKVTIVTLDGHMSGAADRARAMLRRSMPRLQLTVHALSEWAGSEKAAEECRKDIETADIIVANMMFMEDHINAVLPWLEARRDQCDAIVGTLSAGEIVKLTRLGAFDMSKPASGAVSMLRRLAGRGKGKTKSPSGGKGQMKMLRAMPRFLRFIPGKAQDLRSYFLTMQYMLAGSDENLANLVRYLISKYASGPREGLRGLMQPSDPVVYPDVGLYSPHLHADGPTLRER